MNTPDTDDFNKTYTMKLYYCLKQKMRTVYRLNYDILTRIINFGVLISLKEPCILYEAKIFLKMYFMLISSMLWKQVYSKNPLSPKDCSHQ